MNNAALTMKGILEKRVRLCTGGLSLITVLFGTHVIHLFTPLTGGENFTHFFQGVQMGLLLGLEILFIVNLMRYKSVMNDEKRLEDMYVLENDERLKEITQKAGRWPSLINAVVLIIAAVVVGYFSAEAFIALLGAAVFVLAMSKARMIYYKKTM